MNRYGLAALVAASFCGGLISAKFIPSQTILSSANCDVLPAADNSVAELLPLLLENTELVGRLSSNQELKADEVTTLVNTMDYSDISQFLTAGFGLDAVEGIVDQRVFATNLISAYQEQLPAIPASLDIEIAISTTSSFPEFSDTHFTIQPNTTLYAHFKVDMNESPNSDAIFVKWIHMDTGAVVLFDRKLVNSEQNTHWVSYRPPKKWKEGWYGITYYYFTDELTPIAHKEFFVQHASS